MKRLFIAVPVVLSDDFLKLSATIQQKMSRDQVVWVQPQLQHLTLRFLGATPDYQIEPLISVMREISSKNKKFELRLDKIGVFGSRYAPTTIWYGFNEFDSFKNLFEQLEPRLIEMGFEPNYGNLVPHLTVGRIKKIENKQLFTNHITQLQPTFTQSVAVDTLHLIRSKLTPQGPVYKTLEVFPLQ
jgi:2'-5' RNA ligase